MILEFYGRLRAVAWFLLFLATGALPALCATAGEVFLAVAVFGHPGAPQAPSVKVRLHAEPLAGGAAGLTARDWEVAAPGEAKLDLPADFAWRLSAEAPGYWAPVLVLSQGERPPAALLLLPTGTIAGRWNVKAGEPRPAAVEVRFQAAPGQTRPAVPVATVSCPVVEDRWRCTVPAGSLDLRFQIPGFIPRYRWGAAVRPGETLDLGSFDLARGASVLGRVEVSGVVAEARGHSPAVEMSPHLLARPGSAAGQQRLAGKSLSTVAGDRGYFQLAGVAPGQYRVTASLPGFAPARTAPITVVADQETELREPVLLVPPLTLEVHLQPALDAYGQPWQVELQTAVSAQLRQGVGKGPAAVSGIWRKEGLSPGSYDIEVEDMAGSIWRWESIDVAPGMAPYEINLDLVPVAGRITLGKDPLETTLWFGRSEGRQRIRFDSDAKGEFTGYLSQEGEWTVQMALGEDGLSQESLAPVTVKRLSTSPVAKIEIHLPKTRLAALVVDEEGKPARQAQVIVSLAGKEGRGSSSLTDEKGEVHLRGIEPGLLRLSALGRDASSEPVSYTLREDVDDPPARLELHRKLRLKGRILAADGPVGGAVVRFAPALALPPGAPAGKSVGFPGLGVSDADGQFDIALHYSTFGGSLAVFAPGFAARLLALPLDWKPEQDLTVPVSPEGGEVTVELDGSGMAAVWHYRLFHGAAQTSLINFFSEGLAVAGKPGVYTLPRLEPGDFALCSQGQGNSADCVSGTLSSGGVLRLRARQVEAGPTQDGRRP